MAFQASKSKSGLFEIHGLEAFIEKKVAELKQALGLGFTKTAPASKKADKADKVEKPAKAVPAPKAAAPAPVAKKTAAKKSAPVAKTAKADPLAQLNDALDAHAKKAALIKAGKAKDQLLRALIPLYLSKGGFEVSSGTTSKFWTKNGVSFAPPNVAKALREHVGYARRSGKGGAQITPNGVKYVENALK